MSPPTSSRAERAGRRAGCRAGSEPEQGRKDRPRLRHLPSAQVRRRTGDRFTETMEDYRDLFEELQIDPKSYAVFWSSVIYRYRQASGHAPLLRRGTDASIKNMTDDILRAYGPRIWVPHSEWRKALAEGEESLLYEKNGPNARLYHILGRLWWRMRELVYEEKPAPKQRSGARNQSCRHKKVEGDEHSEGDDTYLVGYPNLWLPSRHDTHGDRPT